MNKIKNVHIFGGGTVAHIASHLALSAPAYGTTALRLDSLVRDRFDFAHSHLELTKMAGGNMETSEDVENRVNELLQASATKIIFFSCALIDWEPHQTIADGGFTPLICLDCKRCNDEIYEVRGNKPLGEKLDIITEQLQTIQTLLKKIHESTSPPL